MNGLLYGGRGESTKTQRFETGYVDALVLKLFTRRFYFLEEINLKELKPFIIGIKFNPVVFKV